MHHEAEKLPGHIKRMAHGGLACLHCGGEVDMDGESVNYRPDEEHDDEDDAPQGEALDALWKKALR
jgi:hypothetical protein